MIRLTLPGSVRYVKNGEHGDWWNVAKTNNQVHIGWSLIPINLIRDSNLNEIEKIIRESYARKQKKNGATQDFKSLCYTLDAPSQYLWITFEDGCMWWCTVHDGVNFNENGENGDKGHFWLNCDRPWSNYSLGGRLLAIQDLPGTVTRTAGAQRTICIPQGWEKILRILHDEPNPYSTASREARHQYEIDIRSVIKELSWKDFEQLVDQILLRTGWMRIGTLGKDVEGVDVEARNLAIDEVAFVQVKSTANRTVLNDYVKRFSQRRDRYARMIFAVHSTGTDELKPPSDLPVQLWTADRIASLVVRLGLGEWVEDRLA